MAKSDLRIADFNEVVVTFAGIPIDGWADGDVLTVTREATLVARTIRAVVWVVVWRCGADCHGRRTVLRDSTDVSSWLRLAEIESFRQHTEEAIGA